LYANVPAGFAVQESSMLNTDITSARNSDADHDAPLAPVEIERLTVDEASNIRFREPFSDLP
jgi:hypothetical protein